MDEYSIQIIGREIRQAIEEAESNRHFGWETAKCEGCGYCIKREKPINKQGVWCLKHSAELRGHGLACPDFMRRPK